MLHLFFIVAVFIIINIIINHLNFFFANLILLLPHATATNKGG